MLVRHLCSYFVFFQSIMAMADNCRPCFGKLYQFDLDLMLLDADPACNRTQQRTNFIRTIADDVSLHEQLVLTWPHPPGPRLLKNVAEPLDRLYLKACPGLLVRPSGRYVQRTLPKGLVSFWLLRAVITLQCPPVSIKSDAYYVHIDQWIETSTLGMFSESTGSLPVQNDLDSMRPIIYSPQPDRSVRLDCSQSKNYVATYQLMGYVRRVRLSWSFSGALLPPQPTSTSSVEQSKTNTSDLSATDRSVTPRNVTSWTYPMEPYSTYRLLHPDFGVLIRITSRMLFQGNFSLERKRTLCEFFSGFWCPSSHTGNTTQLTQRDDQEACIQASMRCDKLPDCNPSNSGLSADEISCDISQFNHSIERQERISKLFV
ncbi:hypothetical protein FBUS_05096 [Fasciolopsis buskii]|uniref:Uncharacterized protein n=1 Tax=Fasciolopsis buskii TaxID=27845 RepID=A0A8E0RNQ6_9TREM|nr:hypothetical protein FBUS_05096 [Fasciolopsis buski]